MVGVDEQHPYLLYGPQQDNSTRRRAEHAAVSFGFDHPAQAWTQASGCETGGIWPTPDGKVIWGACKGEVERFNVETGQSQGRWIYPQNRYGHHPEDIKYRFPRQTVVFVSPHNPKVVYQASHVVHRTTDDGVTWEVISPDLTGTSRSTRSCRATRSRATSPARRSTRRSTRWRSRRSSAACSGSAPTTGRSTCRATTARRGRTSRRRTCRRAAASRTSSLAASQGVARTSRSTGILREHDLKPYIYRTDDYGATWTKLTDGLNGIPERSPDARRARGSGARRACSTPAPSSASSSRSTTAAVADAAAEPAGDAGHGPARAPRRSGRSRRWGGRSGSWMTCRRCGSWRRSRADDSRPPVRPRGRDGRDGREAPGLAISVPVGVRQAGAIDLSKPVLFQPATRIRYRRAGGGRGGGAPNIRRWHWRSTTSCPDGFAGPLRSRSPTAPAASSAPCRRRRRAGAAAAGQGRRRWRRSDDPDMRGGGADAAARRR